MEDENLEINEQNTGDEVNQEIDETLNTQGDNQENNQETENKGFNPDEMEFEEEYKFGAYDLSSLKENLNLNEDNIKTLDKMTAKYSELGLTQEQVEGILGMMIEQEIQSQSPEAIKETLVKNLTYEEKKAYKANCNLLKEALKGTEEEKFYGVLTSDPTAVKILSKVINHIKGGKNVSGPRLERETRKQDTELTGEKAVEEFQKYVSENLGYANKEAKQKELLGKLLKEEDKKYFKEVLGL